DGGGRLLQVRLRRQRVGDGRKVSRQVAGDDVGAPARKRQRVRPALAAGRAGDEGHPVAHSPSPGSPRNRGAPPSSLRGGYPGVRISWGGSRQPSMIGSSSARRRIVASGVTGAEGTTSLGSSTVRMPTAWAPEMSSNGRSPTITA